MAINSAFVEDGHSCEPQSNRLLFCTMNHPDPIMAMLSSLERSRLTCLLAKEPSVYASNLDSQPWSCRNLTLSNQMSFSSLAKVGELIWEKINCSTMLGARSIVGRT